MSDLHNAKKYAVRRKQHSIWRNIVTCVAAVVVFCTTYALILPAITMEYSCGKEEHVHVDGCYKLTCGLEQTPGHFHDETCYDKEGKLICGQEEPQSHKHTEACYAPADPTVPADPICGLEETPGHTHDEVTCYALPKVLSCGQQEAAAHAHDPAACYTQQSNLTCGQQESAGHTHSDACYTQQTSIICGLEEGAEHTHTDACRAVNSVLTCALTESAGHAHTDACYTTTSVLTCTLAETAGHTHTDACYTLGDVPELVCTQEETPGHTHTDACYPAASKPQLICGKEEVEVHKHTDECYTLICVLEEHTHTNECQIKEEPSETTAPTDASVPDETTAPTDASVPDETTAPTDASVPDETTAPTDASTPSEGETQPSEGETLPSEGETLPSDETIAEDEVSADGVTLMGAEDEITPLADKEPKPFNEYVLHDAEHKPVSTTTNYDSANGKYETKIKFDFHITGAQLKATDGNFYIDINDEMIVPTDGGPFEIKNGDELTGYFRFETDPTTNKTKMVIEFLDDKVNALEDSDPVDGSMAFWGTANRNVEDDQGNLNINISNNIDVHVPSGEIKNDNVNINQYDLSVTKSAGNIVTTPPDMSKGPDALGTAKIQYTVNVISQKGTPDDIALTDNLNWTSGNPQNCTLTNVKVQKAPVSVSNGVASVGTPTGDVAITQPSPSAGDKNVNWALNLPKLEPNEAYVVTYEYEYSFKADDAVTVESATNTAHATSKVPGGRPEERVDDEDSKTVDKITPPGPNPDLKKSGTENTDDKTITWTVTFNEDRKQFGEGKDFTISDTMLSQGSDLKVTRGGQPLVEGTDYRVENGKLVLINQQSSNDEIVITYTTSSDALNKWTPDGTVNTVENTASYEGHFGPVETTSTLTKEGGSVSKSVAGTVTKGDTLTIPWKVVITPGSDGIPANTVFTDTPENAFDQKVDLSSLQVYYADENGNPVTDGSGNPIPVANHSTPAQAQNSNAVSFTFNEDPFARKDLPANAKTVVVAYNTTTTSVPDYNKEFRNETEVGGKKDEAVYPYINEWVRPEKGGNVSVENDHLKIDWWVKFTTNKNVVTEITDSLKADEPGAHHYTTVPDKLTVWYKDDNGAAVSAELRNGTDYSVIFRDAAGKEVKDLASGDAVSMEISFTQEGGYKLPGAENTERSLEFNYVTKTDAIPDVLTKYPNTVRALDEEKTVEVPYDPNKLEKSVGTHTEDREKGIVTIPWTVKVTSESGKITTPITDSLKKQDGSNTKNHFFPANPNLVITVLDGTEANKVLTRGTDYEVTFYGDYSEPAKDGIGAAAAEGEGNTYMVIKLLPEGTYTIPGGGKTLQLTYNTEAKTIDQGDPEYLDNKVWAVGKEATAQDRIDPPPAAPEDKVAGKIQQNGSGIRIPWTVYIKRGGAPLTQIEDQPYVDNWTYANHYLDVSTIHLEYLDENKQPFDASVPQPPTPEVKAYSGTYDSNFSPDPNTEGKAPVKYMKLLFDEKGAFNGAPDEVQYLKLTYETYCPDVFAESAYSFMNRVKVSGIVKSDSVSIPKVEKTAEDSSGNWVKNPVDVGATANGELKRWRIRAVTSAERESLTITDVLPEYVVLDGLTVKGGKSEYNLNEFKGLNYTPAYNPADGSFSGAQDSWFMEPFPMTATGSCKKNEDGQYVVEITLNPGEGRKIPAGYVVDVYLTPRVDIDSLPHNLQGKQFSLINQAFVSHEAGGGPSNPSTQIWTDPRPDIADGTLKKGRYPLVGGVLNYVVTVNEKAEDLQPDGSSFVLIDTLTYNGSQYDLVPGTLDPADALKGYDIRLDTSTGKMVRFYKPDSQGRLETDKDGKILYGEELASSEWAVTVDTKTKVDGSTEKIIRARVPDNTPLLMLYTYRVEPRLVPTNANADKLAFTYDVSNTVYMYGHKDVEASETGEKVTWQQQLGGGVTRTGNTFTVRKMDAANNAQLLGGAEFAVEVYDMATDSWTRVVRDSKDPNVKFVTNDKGTLTIDTTEEWMQDPVKVEEQKKNPNVDTLKYNTLYRMYEIAPPTGYILPDNPTVYYFYCSGDGEKLPDRLTRGATDLSLGSNLFWLENTSSKAGIHLEKIWMDHRGNVIPGTANQDFQLIQYKSQTNPSASDTNDPLLSTRKLKITVKGHSWEPETKTAVFDTMKNTMMQLTVTNRNPDSNWAAISGTNAVFNPVIPGIRRTPVYQQGSDTVIEKIIFTFPATKVEETTISFNTNISNLDVSLAPLGKSAVLAASLNVAGEGQDLIKTGEEWTITLTPGNGYKWSSDSFDIDPNQAGVQPLPFVEKDADGVTWYYTYVVKEINGSAAYTVSYSNMNSDGELVSMSSGTIQVVNTRLENPPISLPNTGGIGTAMFTLAGLALTGGAGLGLCKTKVKRKRGLSEKE